MFMFVKKMRKIEWNKEGLFLFTIILICIKTTYKRFAQKNYLAGKFTRSCCHKGRNPN